MIEKLRAIYERLITGGSTQKQAIQSGFWVGGINVINRVLQLLKVVILGRLLSPEAFGLLGIALLFISALRRFSGLGLNDALIQHHSDDVDAYLNTVWIMKIARGLVIAAIALLAAPFIAEFFGEPRATPLIQVIGVANLLLALQNPGIVYFSKNLKFHKEFAYKVSSRFVDLSVAVLIAFLFGSLWALAIGIVAMNFVQFLFSYLLHEFRPTIEFNLEYAKEMFDFGKWMLLNAILVFLFLEGDDVFVGWFFTATALGFYQIGYRYSNAPATEITQVINRVAFPTFSKVQDDVSRLREGFFRVVHLSSVISFPMAAGIVVVAPQFVTVILGDQWVPMIPLMQALAIWGGVRSFSKIPGSVFKAVGKPEYNTYILSVQIIILSLTIYPAAKYFGVIGVAYVIIGQAAIIEPIRIYVVLLVVEGSPSRILRLLLYPTLGSVGMYSITLSVDRHVFSGFGFVEFFGLIAVGILSYITLMLVIEILTAYEFRTLYRTVQQAF